MEKKIKIISAVLLVIGCFYWWEVRPIQIRSSCVDWAINKSKNSEGEKTYDQEEFNDYYSVCLHRHGL